MVFETTPTPVEPQEKTLWEQVTEYYKAQRPYLRPRPPRHPCPYCEDYCPCCGRRHNNWPYYPNYTW